MRNPPGNNPPYKSPTGRHSALRFFFCPVFRAIPLRPCSPTALPGAPRPPALRPKDLFSGGWPPDPPHHTFSPPFSFAFQFPDASPPGAPSAAFFAIAPIGCPLSAGSPDMGLCFSRRSLRTSHSPFLPGRTFALPSPVLSACPHPAPANPRTHKKTADVSDIRCFSVVIQIRIRRAASRIQSGRT